MQKVILHGVPYFTDGTHGLYPWEPENPAIASIRLGAYHPTTEEITFDSAAIARIRAHLAEWREKQHPRPRKSTGATSTSKRRRNCNSGAAEPTETSDDE